VSGDLESRPPVRIKHKHQYLVGHVIEACLASHNDHVKPTMQRICIFQASGPSCSAKCQGVHVTKKESRVSVGENDLRKLCPRPARLTVSARTQLRLTRGSPGGAVLMETLMPLKLCEFCCSGAAYLSGVGLQRRRHGRLCFGTEGLEEPEALHTENASARGWRRPGRDVPKGTTRPGRDLRLFRRRR
jgi:hypothetical protein